MWLFLIPSESGVGCGILCKRGFVDKIVSTITLFVGKRLRQLGRFFCSTNPAGSGMIPYPMINRQKHDTPIFLEHVSNACDRWFVEDTNNACLRGSGLIINANVKMDGINYKVLFGTPVTPVLCEFRAQVTPRSVVAWVTPVHEGEGSLITPVLEAWAYR